MPAGPRIVAALVALVFIPSLIASADTGYRIKIANDDWITVHDINRTDPESMCRNFNAVQIVVPLNEATQPLEQSIAKNEHIDTVEFDFTRPGRPYVRIELRTVTVTNVRTLDGSKQRVTMRYGSCSVKEKKAQ